MPSPNPSLTDGLLCYFGHHRCASQWIKSVVADLCAIVGRTRVVHNGAFGFGPLPAILDPGATFLCWMSSDRRFLDDLGPMRGFHVIRDPRDVVVSAYFAHRYSHPIYNDLDVYRERLSQVSESEGLLLEMDRRHRQFDEMQSWDYERPDILELRMEELTTDPGAVLPRIFAFLGLGPDEGMTPRVVSRILERREFSKVAGGREPGQEDVTSHYRKGIAGDWVNHLGPEHEAYFQERYPDLLVRLSYETSASWT